ncbi:MAG: APC family permease [Planctomycetes bacterium]|nr:APC family permease [Planctomycetota bacterium]
MLKREVGLAGAVFMGLGSIVGTGVFVSLGIAAGVAGPAVILAIAAAATVAVFNGLSAAQLAASHPVSGGTYEYGYKYLSPRLGFTAGWMFLCAKTASAATAALGFSGYALNVFEVRGTAWQVPLGVTAVAVLTVLVLSGIRRSSQANAVIVAVTLSALVLFVVAGLPLAWRSGTDHLTPFFGGPAAETSCPVAGLLEACALMFVAYTGYGRIATLGEKVREPEVTIPRAIVLTLVVTMTLYLAVSIGSVKTTWSFSAFTVLIYYALANLAALRLPRDLRKYHPLVPALGLVACLFLACWVERRIWLVGLGLIAGGLVWHEMARRLYESRERNGEQPTPG